MKRVRPPRPEYLKFLSPFDRGVRDLALASRQLVLEEAPEASELIYDAYNAVATGYSFTGRPSDSFMHIAVYARWVNLGFNRGSALRDPDGILRGSGRWIRHIRIARVSDLEAPAVRKFVQAAIALAERPAVVAPSQSVVRAVYPKKRRPAAPSGKNCPPSSY